jgi:transcriptional regulator with XRE-family HTH domain
MGASADRAVRFRQIRDALGTTQREFAERLNAVAKALDLPCATRCMTSRREIGRRSLDAEDYAVLSSIDPLKWSWEWLAFGRKLTRGTKVAGRAARTGTD